MRQIDFDKAFPETPGIIRTAIEETIERKEKAMKMRHKLTTALSVAAACMILTALVAFAAGSLGGNTADRVTPVQPAVTEDEGEAWVSEVGTTPEPVAVNAEDGTILAAVSVPEEAGETEPDTQSVAIIGGADGPTAIFLTDGGAEYPALYADPEGSVYHVDPACAAENAILVDRSFVTEMSMAPCAVCVMGFVGFVEQTAADLPVVYVTEYGKYCHAVSDCSGMENAVEQAAQIAADSGYEPCPVCMPDGWDTVFTAADPDTVVYMTEFGAYYHADSGCSGMEGASESTVSEAQAAGKTACPICMINEP